MPYQNMAMNRHSVFQRPVHHLIGIRPVIRATAVCCQRNGFKAVFRRNNIKIIFNKIKIIIVHIFFVNDISDNKIIFI
ncbi:hypothetical protein R84B8_01424 [Treponema sp. R8-4-B8]